jgi:hypothetical protein
MDGSWNQATTTKLVEKDMMATMGKKRGGQSTRKGGRIKIKLVENTYQYQYTGIVVPATVVLVKVNLIHDVVQQRFAHPRKEEKTAPSLYIDSQ